MAGSGSFELLQSDFVGCIAEGVGAAVNYEPTADVSHDPVFNGSSFFQNDGLSTVSAAALVVLDQPLGRSPYVFCKEAHIDGGDKKTFLFKHKLCIFWYATLSQPGFGQGR